MNEQLLAQLEAAQTDLDPQFRALRNATGALKRAVKLASEERLDALAMNKLLAKLQEAAAQVESIPFETATNAYTAQTQQALNDLAFDFAKDLRDVFQARGLDVEGRPPTLSVGLLVLQIDVAARKAQWFYGKEPLTRPIPLSINNLLKAYDVQHKAIEQRVLDAPKFVAELYVAWNELLSKRSQRPSGGRVNLVELFAQVTMNRQVARFWNAPSRSTFRDYDRAHFVRDLVLAMDELPVEVDGKELIFHLAGATKTQAESAAKSIWIPTSALAGEYYASITFDQ